MPLHADNVADYALWWFAIQIVLAGTTIVIGLAACRSSTVDQAIQSRKFIPTPHHYQLADGFAQAHGLLSGVKNGTLGEDHRTDV
jgi:hypothetical protein